ncbi:MAG: undecaprenyl-diphosphate phosphatase [Lachnospiraceae bacterium]|nr:undecaprenyl-diphosphate phosphatase [Lachnospiraceae bacterium]
MSVLQAILIGLVHGITEFLPVSSSGHLIFMWKLMQITAKDEMFFDVCLHVATLIVICLAFRSDIKRLLGEALHMLQDVLQNLVIWFSNKRQLEQKQYVKIISSNYRRFVILLLIAEVPTAVIGFLLRGLSVEALNSLLAPAMGFFLTAVVLLVTELAPEDISKTPKNATCAEAAAIGVFQGLSVFPGISRAGVTLSACFLCGFSRKFAIKFCYLASIPAIVGALILELRYTDFSGVTWQSGLTAFLSMVMAVVTGFFVIRFVFRLLNRKRLKIFAAYSIIAGCVLIAGHFLL